MNKILSKGKRFYMRFGLWTGLFSFLLLVLIFLYGFFAGVRNPKDLIKTKFPKLYKPFRKMVLKLDREMPGIGEKMGLPYFQLVLSGKDIHHFSDLYKKYFDENHGIYYYAENNKWRKALLIYKGKEYRIKIKSHGRRPTGHKHGRFMSYAIKLEKGEQIKECRRFSLIVRERLLPSMYYFVPGLAKEFNLLIQHNELARVTINNGKEKLYYFESKLDNAYMEIQGKSSLRMFSHAFSPYDSIDKAMIYTGIGIHKSEFDPQKFEGQFTNVFKKLGIPENHRPAIYERYLSLNLAIAEGKYKQIHNYFDLDYISSFEAARAIGGFNGHGYTRGNLYVFYDTANGKFYPALHRDFFTSFLILEENGTIEQQISNWPSPAGPVIRLPILHLFARNDTIRQEKYRKIYRFITEKSDAFSKKQRKTVIFYEKVCWFDWLKWTLRNLDIEIAAPYKDYAGSNIKILKPYLEESSLKMTIQASKNELVFELLPRSISAIRFDSLILKKSMSSPENQKVQIKIIFFMAGKVDRVFKVEKSLLSHDAVVNMTGMVRNLEFSTAIGKELQRVPRKYVFIISFDKKVFKSFSKQDFEVSFRNTVTGKKVAQENMLWEEAGIDIESLKGIRLRAVKFNEK